MVAARQADQALDGIVAGVGQAHGGNVLHAAVLEAIACLGRIDGQPLVDVVAHDALVVEGVEVDLRGERLAGRFTHEVLAVDLEHNRHMGEAARCRQCRCQRGEVDVVLRDVVEDDLRVGEAPLQARLIAGFVVAEAMHGPRARGDVDQLDLQVVELAVVRRRGVEAEDVDDLLLVQHAREVGVDVVGVLEDLPSRRGGEDVQRFEGVVLDGALGDVVLQAHALDVDGIQDHVGAAEVLRHLVEQLEAGRAAVALVVVDVPDLAGGDGELLPRALGVVADGAPLNELGVEALGEEDDLFAAREAAQGLGDGRKHLDLILGARAVPAVGHARFLLAELADHGRGFVVPA